MTSIAFKGAAGPFSLDAIPASVPAQGTAEFTVVYKPMTDGSTDHAIVLVTTKDTDIPEAEIEVFGEGTKAEAILSVQAPDPVDPKATKTYTCDNAGITVSLEFGQTSIGATKSEVAKVSNTGPSNMNVTIKPANPDPEFTITAPTPGADGGVTFTVEPGKTTAVAFTFKPDAAGVKFADYSLLANDVNCKTDNVIQLHGKGVTSVIQVCGESDGCPADNPSCICTDEGTNTIQIQFGDVKQGEKASKKIEIANIGDNAATITKIALDQASTLYSLDKTVPPNQTLDAQATFIVAVTYAPTAGTTEPIPAVKISVETSPGHTEDFTVDLSGSSQPTLCVAPDGIMTFVVAPGQSGTQQATVTNCGYADLVIDSIAIDPTSGTPQSYALDALPPMPKTVAAGDSFQFNVKFTNNPQISGDSAQIMIISNDPYYNGASNPYYLALTSGDNTSDMPPVAVAKAPDGDVQKAKDTELPKTITLDGSGSTDTDATPIASYEWKLVAVPKGSALTPNSSADVTNATSVSASFAADKYGIYTIQLIATDTIGQASMPSVIKVGLIKDL